MRFDRRAHLFRLRRIRAGRRRRKPHSAIAIARARRRPAESWNARPRMVRRVSGGAGFLAQVRRRSSAGRKCRVSRQVAASNGPSGASRSGPHADERASHADRAFAARVSASPATDRRRRRSSPSMHVGERLQFEAAARAKHQNACIRRRALGRAECRSSCADRRSPERNEAVLRYSAPRPRIGERCEKLAHDASRSLTKHGDAPRRARRRARKPACENRRSVQPASRRRAATAAAPRHRGRPD